MANDALIRRIATAAALASVAVVALTIAAIAVPSIRARVFGSRPPSYRAGDPIDVPARLYNTSRLTAVLFVRSNCDGCQRAKPAYKTIVDRLSQKATPVFVITSGAHGADEIGYVRDLGLDATHLVAMDVGALRVQVVPTLVLVNQQGRILYSHEGLVSEDQQAEISQFLPPSKD